jgi:hypothetical protein
LIAPAIGFPAPITYIVNFALNPTNAGQPNFDLIPTAGGFSYDSANLSAPFSNFIVLWRGATFDLTTAANTTSPFGFGCDSQTTAPQFGTNVVFQTFTSPCTNVYYVWSGIYNTGLGIEQFVFVAGSMVQAQVEGLIFFNNPSGVSQSGQGPWTLSAVPEPATLNQLVIGSLALATLRSRLRRRRSSLREHKNP